MSRKIYIRKVPRGGGRGEYLPISFGENEKRGKL
jgi:hypothetical protein